MGGVYQTFESLNLPADLRARLDAARAVAHDALAQGRELGGLRAALKVILANLLPVEVANLELGAEFVESWRAEAGVDGRRIAAELWQTRALGRTVRPARKASVYQPDRERLRMAFRAAGAQLDHNELLGALAYVACTDDPDAEHGPECDVAEEVLRRAAALVRGEAR